MQLEFGYGSSVQTVELPQENLLGVLHAALIEHERRGPDAVSWALAHPIGSAPLHALARPGQRIAIVTSDITRPLPSYQILPGVLVSQGGAPKDANLYQTQKALDNAKHAVKDGGTIILIGACPEGLGSKTFSDWLLAAPTAHSMVERISRDFQLGGHKAAAIAMVLEKASIDLISEMDDDFVRRIFLEPKPSAQAALDAAFRKYGPSATVLAMPHGGSTLPYLQDAGPDHSRT